jgi:hypothetical protein
MSDNGGNQSAPSTPGQSSNSNPSSATKLNAGAREFVPTLNANAREFNPGAAVSIHYSATLNLF